MINNYKNNFLILSDMAVSQPHQLATRPSSFHSLGTQGNSQLFRWAESLLMRHLFVVLDYGHCFKKLH